MLMRFLPEAEASSASALSIRRLCDGCAPLLAASSMDPLMQLYRQIQGSGERACRLVQLYRQIQGSRERACRLIQLASWACTRLAGMHAARLHRIEGLAQ